ncbi:MAG: hypothetical protein OMM_10526, partial [Candidatus Magnetoglobus multicellularis str. Araruama]
MKKSVQHPKAFNIEMLEPRLLLSANPIVESFQEIMPKAGIPETVVNVDEALDAYKNLENKTASKLVQELARYHAKKQDQQPICIQSDFFDLEKNGHENQSKLDFSDISEDLTFILDKDGSMSVSSIAVSILDDGTISFSNNDTVSHYSIENVDSITGGQGQNTFLLDENTTFNGLIESHLGEDDALFILNGDNIWQIDGLNSGQVGDILFSGVEHLIGGGNNQDTFVFSEEGHISGSIDGGWGGFDTLEIEGAFDTIEFTAFSSDAGTVTRDNQTIFYSGLEPIYDNTDSTNRIIGLSNNDDTDARLTSSGNSFTLSGSTFESITFVKPSESLHIQGLSGTDTITLESLDLGDTALIIDAENIILPTGKEITTSANIQFNALNKDDTTIETADDIIDRTANISIAGNIHTEQNLSLIANTTRDINISITDASNLSLSAISDAIIDIQSANITASDIQISAATDGSILAKNSLGAAKNEFTNNAQVIIENNTIAANLLDIKALRDTDYDVSGRDAYNHIIGDTQSWINQSTITTTSDISILAKDESSFKANSSEMIFDLSLFTSPVIIETASARNYLSGNVTSGLTDTNITLTGEHALSVVAEKALQVSATAATNHLTSSSILPSDYSISLDGTYSSNVLLGHVKAFVETSDISAGTSNITIQAKEVSAIDSRTTIAATSDINPLTLNGYSATIGTSIAFNALGWDPGNAALAAIDTLLNTTFASQDPMDVQAYILDSKVSAANIDMDSSLETKLNATVSNTSKTTSSALFGASGMSSSGILSSNMLSTNVKTYIDNTSDAQTIQVAGTIDLSADDNAQIYANSKIVSSAIITNDGGVSILNDTIAEVISADFETTDGTQSIDFGNRIRLSDDYENGGNKGSVYIYMGTVATLNLNEQDYSNKDLWKEVKATQILPEGNNLTDSNSVALGGMVVRNDIRNKVATYINNTQLAAGTVNLAAREVARIHAIADSTAESSGGSAFGSGQSLAVNGVIATNLILSQANAYITNSNITTTGDLKIDAQNTSTIDAINTSVTTTGDTGVGVSLAFNIIGWESQNVLFNTIDALIGTSIGNAQPDEVKAYILDTELDITGNLSLSAISQAQLTASVSNASTSAASALMNASGIAVSGILAS